MKKRFNEGQIVGFLKEADRGVPVPELCRKNNFSGAGYYLWRSKYGGVDISDAKRRKALQAKDAKLKKLLAESIFENEIVKEALLKNGYRTGSSGARAVDANEGLIGAAVTRGCSHGSPPTEVVD